MTSSPVALITGASRGIGRAAAVALAGLGYRLALVGRTPGDLAETARLAGGELMIHEADVTDAAGVCRVVEETVERFGQLDAAINVAGVAPVLSIEAMTVDEWHEVIDTNLSAVFYTTKYAWSHLRQSAIRNSQSAIPQPPPAVVNVSSVSARDPFAGFAAYGAAKAGLNLFALAAAREGAADGIAVHTVAPGATETAMFRQIATPEQWPAEKTLSPDDVAAVICDCVTGRLRHTSGEVIYVHKTV